MPGSPVERLDSPQHVPMGKPGSPASLLRQEQREFEARREYRRQLHEELHTMRMVRQQENRMASAVSENESRASQLGREEEQLPLALAISAVEATTAAANPAVRQVDSSRREEFETDLLMASSLITAFEEDEARLSVSHRNRLPPAAGLQDGDSDPFPSRPWSLWGAQPQDSK